MKIFSFLYFNSKICPKLQNPAYILIPKQTIDIHSKPAYYKCNLQVQIHGCTRHQEHLHSRNQSLSDLYFCLQRAYVIYHTALHFDLQQISSCICNNYRGIHEDDQYFLGRRYQVKGVSIYGCVTLRGLRAHIVFIKKLQ